MTTVSPEPVVVHSGLILVENLPAIEKIHVACRPMDETNTKAEWNVEIGTGDARNKNGLILGELAIQRADLTAMQKALEMAHRAGLRRPFITTDSKYLYMVDRFHARWRSIGWTYINGSELLNEKLIVQLDAMYDKFESVRFQLVPGPRYIPKY